MSAPSKEKLLESRFLRIGYSCRRKAGDIKKAIDAHEASLNATDAAKLSKQSLKQDQIPVFIL